MPERWPRIVALAAETGTQLPPAPDARALEQFLLQRRAADPDRFADLSLSVVKLLGRGEYVVEQPNEPTPDHFGLAVDDYTAFDRAQPAIADLVTQRLIKAALAGRDAPYTLRLSRRLRLAAWSGRTPPTGWSGRCAKPQRRW